MPNKDWQAEYGRLQDDHIKLLEKHLACLQENVVLKNELADATGEAVRFGRLLVNSQRRVIDLMKHIGDTNA